MCLRRTTGRETSKSSLLQLGIECVRAWTDRHELGSFRYLILDVLGQGTFGQVVKCQNMRTHEIVAVKVVKNKPAYFNQSMMEVAILQLVRNVFLWSYACLLTFHTQTAEYGCRQERRASYPTDAGQLHSSSTSLHRL